MKRGPSNELSKLTVKKRKTDPALMSDNYLSLSDDVPEEVLANIFCYLQDQDKNSLKLVDTKFYESFNYFMDHYDFEPLSDENPLSSEKEKKIDRNEVYKLKKDLSHSTTQVTPDGSQYISRESLWDEFNKQKQSLMFWVSGMVDSSQQRIVPNIDYVNLRTCSIKCENIFGVTYCYQYAQLLDDANTPVKLVELYKISDEVDKLSYGHTRSNKPFRK